MANDKTFGYKLVKITLIILNAFVVVAVTCYLPTVFMKKDTFLIAFVFFLEWNYFTAIAGALLESRPLVLISTACTLVILFLVVIIRPVLIYKRTWTFVLFYFLAIVVLSHTFYGYLQEREQCQGVRARKKRSDPGNGQPSDPSTIPFTAVVVDCSSNGTVNTS